MIVAVRSPSLTALPTTDGSRLQRRRPEAVRQDGDAGGLRPVVLRADQAPLDRAQAHHFEVRAANDAGAHDARLAEADHGELDGGEVAERRDRRHPRLEVAQLGDRKDRVLEAQAGGAVADVNQPVLAAIGERPQQHAADDAEDGGVGTDAESQRQDDRQGQPGRLGQRSKRHPKIRQETHVTPLLRVRTAAIAERQSCIGQRGACGDSHS